MAMWGKPWLLALLALVLAILLISEIPMFSLKLTSFSWSGNALLYCFLGAVIIGFAVWGVKALSCMIPVYILISCYDFKKNGTGGSGNTCGTLPIIEVGCVVYRFPGLFDCAYRETDNPGRSITGS